MPDILKLISQADRLDFSQNYGISRPNFLGDTLFPDIKTQSLQAEYLRMASGWLCNIGRTSCEVT